MLALRKSRDKRIANDIDTQSDYVVSAVEGKIAAGESSPYNAYAYVRGLSQEDTAHKVGQAALEKLGDGFMLDAAKAERASEMTRLGAFITFVRFS